MPAKMKSKRNSVELSVFMKNFEARYKKPSDNNKYDSIKYLGSCCKEMLFRYACVNLFLSRLRLSKKNGILPDSVKIEIESLPWEK